MMLMAIAQRGSEQALVPHPRRSWRSSRPSASDLRRRDSGRALSGRIRTYAVIRRPHHERFLAHLPIALALIELEEGVEVISTIVGENRLDTAIDARVAAARHRGWSPLVQSSLEGP